MLTGCHCVLSEYKYNSKIFCTAHKPVIKAKIGFQYVWRALQLCLCIFSSKQSEQQPSPRAVICVVNYDDGYRQVSDIRRTKSQNLNDSRSVLRLHLPNPLKPDVKSRMKM